MALSPDGAGVGGKARGVAVGAGAAGAAAAVAEAVAAARAPEAAGAEGAAAVPRQSCQLSLGITPGAGVAAVWPAHGRARGATAAQARPLPGPPSAVGEDERLAPPAPRPSSTGGATAARPGQALTPRAGSARARGPWRLLPLLRPQPPRYPPRWPHRAWPPRRSPHPGRGRRPQRPWLPSPRQCLLRPLPARTAAPPPQSWDTRRRPAPPSGAEGPRPARACGPPQRATAVSGAGTDPPSVSPAPASLLASERPGRRRSATRPTPTEAESVGAAPLRTAAQTPAGRAGRGPGTCPGA